MDKKPLVIFGSAEMARLARFYFEHDSEYRVVAFTVDDAQIDADDVEGLLLIPFGEVASKFPPGEAAMHVALSYRGLNSLRQAKYEQAKQAGYELASYVCSKSALWLDRSIGENCFILENQTIQPAVTIGNNVMIWSGNHLGHGSSISDHTYIASHVVISGHCKIGQRCFLGVNATLRDFLNVGDDVFVGMHAAVVQDVPAGSVVVGQSGEVLPADDRRAKFLKKKYFGV
jgi:sugar O-acyltransferase (sialic acid O-acetyltransferase NeuD family)